MACAQWRGHLSGEAFGREGAGVTRLLEGGAGGGLPGPGLRVLVHGRKSPCLSAEVAGGLPVSPHCGSFPKMPV